MRVGDFDLDRGKVFDFIDINAVELSTGSKFLNTGIIDIFSSANEKRPFVLVNLHYWTGPGIS